MLMVPKADFYEIARCVNAVLFQIRVKAGLSKMSTKGDIVEIDMWQNEVMNTWRNNLSHASKDIGIMNRFKWHGYMQQKLHVVIVKRKFKIQKERREEMQAIRP